MKKFFTDYKVLVFSGGTVDAEVEMSDDIRFLYVVDGSASVQVSEHITNMEKSDTLVVNSGEVCHLKMDKSAMLVVISMDYYNLCDSLETASLSFYVNSAEDTGHKYTLNP